MSKLISLRAEGSIMGSLEFSIGALNTQLILVLGHTSCGAILGAAKALRQNLHLLFAAPLVIISSG